MAKTKKELFRDLLLLKMDEEGELMTQSEEELSEIRWEELVDNAAEMWLGWSMFRDTRNKFVVNEERWIYD